MQWLRSLLVICLFLGGGVLLSACSAEDLTSIPKSSEKKSAPDAVEGMAEIEAPSKLDYPEALPGGDDKIATTPLPEALRKEKPAGEGAPITGAKPKVKVRKFEIDQAEKDGFHRVKVFYGTNRNRTGETEANNFYGKTRGEMTYGICEVAIPLTHKAGALEAPKWWKLEFNEDPTKHVVLQKVDTLSWRGMAAQLNDMISKAHGKNAFIFVHGYNVAFKDAARRTAQIHHDLKFDGAPIFFSWPSRGEITLTSYTHDETNAKWSYSYLKEFLIKVATDTEADNIYLVAHSMGTRVLSNAIAGVVTDRPDLKKRFKEIILAAPDIDAEVFINDLAPKLVQASRNTTLYASADDRALQTSREVHGGYARAGDAGENLIVMDDIDTIDATGVDASLLGHSYFAEATSILRDIKELVGLSKPAHARTYLIPKTREADGRRFFVVKRD